jgi:hypothetical protein
MGKPLCGLALSCAIGLVGEHAAWAQSAPPAGAESAPPPAAAPLPAPPPAPATAPDTATPAAATPPPAEPAPAVAPADAAPAAPAPTAFAPLKVETPNATLKLGLLAQPQYEAIGTPNPALSGASQNLYLRRIRLLVGGTLFKNFEYFFDTDSPNLGKANATTGAKNILGMNVQDAFVTFKAVDDLLKIDAGYMLPPLAHNAVQGAGTLYGWDYFANSFRHASAFGSEGDVGRDAGVQLRGLVLDNHLEYRAGLFQGLRDAASATKVGSRNFFRFAARIQVNVLDPETGFFYAGTYLGAKRVLSFGASYDVQDHYKHWSVDGFLDMPLGPGGLTAQVNVAQWNGDDFLVAMAGMPPAPVPALPKQTAIMSEAGYRFDAVQLSPILRFEHRNVSTPSAGAPTEDRFGAGLAYWPYGHNVNLKAFYTRIKPSDPAGLNGYNQFNLQWQVYLY